MAASGMHKGSCNHCQEHIEYPEDFEGSEVTCPHCGQPTLLKQEVAASSGEPVPPSMGSMGEHGRATAVGRDTLIRTLHKRFAFNLV